MRVLPLHELMHLTRIELCDLARTDHERLAGPAGRLHGA